MDFLNKTLAQLNDLFRSMTVGARITAGLLLVVVVVSLFYLFRFQAGGPEADLMRGMPVPASHLPLMETAFGKAGLTSYEVRGTQILVPRGQEAVYMAALADAEALPPNFGSAIRKAVETGNVFDSKEDKERRMRVATQEELSQIIASMQGIESAYVFFAVDRKYGLRREEVKTAAVSVKPLGDRQLDPADVTKIRHLVAGAFGMKYENVTVADHNGRAYFGDGETGGSMEDNLYVALTRGWEQDYKTKVLSSLSFIPNLTVEPIVILDRERILRIRKTQLDPKPVAIRTTEETTSRTRQGGGPGGRVGYVAQQANTPTALASATGAGNQEEEDTSHTDTQSIPSGSQEERESVGLTPKQVKVSVGIPSSYFVKVWRERNPVADGEEPKEPTAADLERIRQEESAKIQAHVAALLPPAEGVDDLAQLVTVTTFTDLPSSPPPEPGTGKTLLVWLGGAWRTLAVVGLALVSLVMLRSLVRAAPIAAGPQSMLPGLFAAESTAAEQAPTEGAASPRPFSRGGRSLSEELSELVEEDPDTAANILKSWIGSV